MIPPGKRSAHKILTVFRGTDTPALLSGLIEEELLKSWPAKITGEIENTGEYETGSVRIITTLYDVNGKRYLDGSSGAMVSNIGHSNPYVLDAMKRQMDKATFGYRLHFQNEPAERLATMTANMMPAGLDRVFFVSGGSEAVESAIKLARQYAITQGKVTAGR